MGGKGKEIAGDAKQAAETQLQDFQAQTAKAQAAVDAQKKAYKDIEFRNPYAGMRNQFEGMENTMQDLTVNQQQAQFQAQQGAQQRANIMQGLRGAAGGSGIAGLAQAMANQGQLQTQQISASIGQQEAANQRAAAQQAGQLQMMERQGAASVDLQRRQGEAMVQEAESGRAATLLGMEYGALAGAQAGVQQAYANQQAAYALDMERTAANKAVWGQAIGAVGSLLGGAATGGFGAEGAFGSDRRLKKNINKIGESFSGLNIYSFEYIDSKYGEGLFQGVMSDEIPQEAVSVKDGYDYVDYSMLDVEFKQI